MKYPDALIDVKRLENVVKKLEHELKQKDQVIQELEDKLPAATRAKDKDALNAFEEVDALASELLDEPLCALPVPNLGASLV